MNKFVSLSQLPVLATGSFVDKSNDTGYSFLTQALLRIQEQSPQSNDYY
ncbi:MAG: hypothetical protein LBK61_00965 [Spirochaetaceae bacterium]|nr:hypothetical protein [Spirochaetaceae bacterium]